jgi:hypothetical protein
MDGWEGGREGGREEMRREGRSDRPRESTKGRGCRHEGRMGWDWVGLPARWSGMEWDGGDWIGLGWDRERRVGRGRELPSISSERPGGAKGQVPAIGCAKRRQSLAKSLGAGRGERGAGSGERGGSQRKEVMVGSKEWKVSKVAKGSGVSKPSKSKEKSKSKSKASKESKGKKTPGETKVKESKGRVSLTEGWSAKEFALEAVKRNIGERKWVQLRTLGKWWGHMRKGMSMNW